MRDAYHNFVGFRKGVDEPIESESRRGMPRV